MVFQPFSVVFLLLPIVLDWLVLVGAGWCWLVLVGAGWCWLVLVGAGWCWLVLFFAEKSKTPLSWDRDESTALPL